MHRLSARIDANERTQFESLLSQKRLEDTTKSLSSTVQRYLSLVFLLKNNININKHPKRTLRHS